MAYPIGPLGRAETLAHPLPYVSIHAKWWIPGRIRLRQQGSSIYFFQIFARRAKIWKK
jgi:hypothetical protein